MPENDEIRHGSSLGSGSGSGLGFGVSNEACVPENDEIRHGSSLGSWFGSGSSVSSYVCVPGNEIQSGNR